MTDLPTKAGAPPQLIGWDRTRAWLDMLFVDHGFLREMYGHIHKVDDGLYRAAQPGPRRLKWVKEQGFKTVLNLRGERNNCGSYILEREACHEQGLTLVNFPIRSRGALDKETLLAACALFDDLEYPIFMHCKSGADRTGFMATLYLHMVRGEPISEARRHLSLKFGHIRQAKTGVIDFFYDRYEELGLAKGLSLPEWIEQDYDKAELNAAFKENWVAGIIVNKILRRE